MSLDLNRAAGAQRDVYKREDGCDVWKGAAKARARGNVRVYD